MNNSSILLTPVPVLATIHSTLCITVFTKKDGRLRLGDHIVCVQDFNVRGFGSDQVATVIRHVIQAALFTSSNAVSHSSTRQTLLDSVGSASPPATEDEPLDDSDSLVKTVQLRLIVARPTYGDSDSLEKIYDEQQRLCEEHQLFNTVRCDEFMCSKHKIGNYIGQHRTILFFPIRTQICFQ